MKKTIVIIFCLASFLSCNEKTERTQTTIKKVKKIEFKVEISLKSNKDDIFKVMLNNIVVDDFQTKSIHFSEKIIETVRQDEFAVNFGDNKSQSLLINLGNKNEKIIDVYSVKLYYNGRSVIITSENVLDHFILNKFISINSKGQLVTKRISGQHNPIIVFKAQTLNNLFSDI